MSDPENIDEYVRLRRDDQEAVRPKVKRRLQQQVDQRAEESNAALYADLVPDPQTNAALQRISDEPSWEPTWNGDPLPDEPRTELGYARRFVHQYGHMVRFVSTWNHWLLWDGTRWSRDTTKQHRRWMTVIARTLTNDALAIVDSDKRRAAMREAKRGESSSAIAGALTLASTEADVVIDHADLDADVFLLNCRNGTLDLRTGELRKHDPGDLITKLAGADYRPKADGTEFHRFLKRIQPDQTMRTFLARLLGHTLEGRQVEHVLPIMFGEGANGKSTLLDVVNVALGEYGGEAAPGLLTARNFDAHPTELADLFGLRLAVVQETDAGRRLAEGTVKRLTGGDRIKARRMRQDFWEFDPTHTFVMATNHRPIVAGNDEGIWRRLRLVPFDVVIPKADRDVELPSRLALEADAILAWLVEGYQQWHDQGLDEPELVTAATDAYRAESDAIGRFLDECCKLAPALKAQSSALYQAWARWCATEGEEAGSNKSFTTALHNRGHDTTKSGGRMVWRGIGLLTEGPEWDR